MTVEHSKAHGGVLFAAGVRRTATSACLIALMAGVLLYLYTGSQSARVLSWCALLGFCSAAIGHLGFRERVLLVVCLCASAALALKGDSEGIMRALDQGAFLAAFIQLMGLLREAAVRSTAIRDAGAYITRQPPKRRGLAILAGGHGFGVLLNFGSISLLAPLIQQGVQASSPDAEIARIREQRQLSALIRGFSWIVVWAPTSVTQALLADSLTGLDGHRLVLLGLGATAMVLTIAWLEDYFAWRATGARLRSSGRLVQDTPAFPRRAFRNLAGICALLIGMTLAIRWLAGVATVPALMLTAPLSLVFWTIIQNVAQADALPFRSTGRDLQQIAAGPIPNGARESATLGASGFIGVAAAALAPIDLIASWSATALPSPALFLMLLPLLVILAGQIALSPVMMVVFLASVVSAFPVPPADPTLIAFSLACGWALTMTGAPNASGALLLARMTGHSAIELTWYWNLRFTLIAYACLALVFLLLTNVF